MGGLVVSMTLATSLAMHTHFVRPLGLSDPEWHLVGMGMWRLFIPVLWLCHGPVARWAGGRGPSRYAGYDPGSGWWFRLANASCMIGAATYLRSATNTSLSFLFML